MSKTKPTAPNVRRNKNNPYLIEWDDHDQGNCMWNYSILTRSPKDGFGFSQVGTVPVDARSVDLMKKRWMYGAPWLIVRIRATSPMGMARSKDVYVGKGFPEGKSLDISKEISKYRDLMDKFRLLMNRHIKSWAKANNQRRTAAIEAHHNARTACTAAFKACAEAVRYLDSRGKMPEGKIKTIQKAVKFAETTSKAADKSNTKFPKPAPSKWVVTGTDRRINAEQWPDWDRSVPWLVFENDGDVYLEHKTTGVVPEKGFTWAMDGGSFQSGKYLAQAMKDGMVEGRLNIQVTGSTFSAVFNIPKGSKKPPIVHAIPQKSHHHDEEKSVEVKGKIEDIQIKLGELADML